RIWFGLKGHLLSRTESSFVNTRLYNTDLKSNHLSSCYIDPWDNAWLSYYESPWISKITNTEIEHIPAPDDGPYGYDLCGNSARGLYLSTQAGRIFHRFGDAWHTVPVQLSYSSLRGTPWQDKILYSSRGLGIIVVDNETVSYINTTTPDNSINNSYYIAVDPQNRIWFDNRALFSIENGEITQHPPFIDNLMTRSLAAAPDGSIWIGVLSSDYDLARYDPQTHEYTTLDLPGGDFGAHQLCFDPQGYLWIIGDNNVYTYRPDQGFSTVLSYLNYDYDLVDLSVDNDGRVWLLTEQGAFIFTTNPSATEDPVLTPPASLISSLSCYPNPFRGSLSIALDLREGAFSSVEVYNMRGQLIRTIASRAFSKGKNTMQWDGRDNSGASCSTGIYLIKASSGKETLSRKILIP
ncbi:MAG TPA: FlgD immunoglobulin-like domain containing protein, partial [Candidatus Cloacimonadota bacterium]|nr:FlgD immunoglobulin-like domain containing protein [Candidatus Cloacimonadota bacterium]